MKKTALVLTLIIILAATLRLFALSTADPLGDEVLYSFRAIGPMDFDTAALQTTPLEWFDPDIPVWTNLSFHDHPPLVFLIQHFFLRLFGENNFAFRLPSVLFGVASVYLIYLLSRRLFTSRAAPLFAAALLAVTINQVFISRTGLQESIVIFFILFTLFFIQCASPDNPRFFYAAGAALGLGLLSKYTAAIAAIIGLFYLLSSNCPAFKNRHLWGGLLLAVLLFSPVIFYNLKLYQSVGHFDFQISYILGQRPEVWASAPGKEEIGTLSNRLSAFLPTLIGSNSPLLLLLAAASLFTLRRRHALIYISLASLILLYLFIGPTVRFLTMLTPFLILPAAAFFDFIILRAPSLTRLFYFSTAIFLILAAELAFTANTLFPPRPFGQSRLTYAPLVVAETSRWGYNQLDSYLTAELANRFPARVFDSRYQFISNRQDDSLAAARAASFSPYAALIIYDDSLWNVSQLWILDRRQIYHGWPTIKIEDFLAATSENGPDYFRRSGFTNFYFILPSPDIPLKNLPTETGVSFASRLSLAGLSPLVISSPSATPAFSVFKWTAAQINI